MPLVAEVMPYGGDWSVLRAHLATLQDVVDRFVLVESDVTFSGHPRRTELAGRIDELPVDPERVRIITMSLPTGPASPGSWRRAAAQRDAGFMGVADLGPDSLILLADVDEIVDPGMVRHLAEHLDQPRRIYLTACYQYLDRRAPSWHCCHLKSPLELRRLDPHEDDAGTSRHAFTFPGPVACRRSDLGPPGPLSISSRRRRVRGGDRSPQGWHLTGIDPRSREGRKEQSVAHAFTGRIVDPAHMARCTAAGVHHQGWWYVAPVDAGDLEPALVSLAEQIPGSLAPTPLPSRRVRRALRAWCELRQNRRLPDRIVAAVDHRLDAHAPATIGMLAAVDRLLVRSTTRPTTEAPRHPDGAVGDGLAEHEHEELHG